MCEDQKIENIRSKQPAGIVSLHFYYYFILMDDLSAVLCVKHRYVLLAENRKKIRFPRTEE